MNRIVMRRPPKEQKKSVINNLLYEYCSTTSLHGIKHLEGQDKTLIERTWWLMVFILSICMCSYLIAETWSKWQNNPVTLSFSSRQNLISDIPFPAVTICPLNKVQKTVYNYTKMFAYRHILTGENKKRFWDVSLICNHLWKIDINSSLTTDKEAIESLLLVAPSLNMTFLYTYQNNLFVDPESLFADHITEEGLCFTYNAFSHNDMYTDEVDSTFQLIKHNRSTHGWNLENGYSEDAGIKPYPRRATLDGVTAGLGLVLYNNQNDTEYACGNTVKGFKVLLHNPAEAPRLQQKFIYVPLGMALSIAINVKMLTSSEGLKNIPIESRNCYFPHERTLRFYKIYTQDNCKKECFANITQSQCLCLPFHYPRDSSTPICGYGRTFCSNLVDVLMYHYQSLLKNNKQVEDEGFEIYKKCNCLPACWSLDYETENSHADYILKDKLFVTNQQLINSDTVDLTNVFIYFKKADFSSLHRQELYGRTDFLASCGGLLGLFLGFSLISVIEIVYFVTLRLWCSVHRNRKPKIYHFIN